MAAPRPLNEDDIYRSSSQYRLWSFTKESLAEMRATTNRIAAKRVRAAFNKVAERNGVPTEEVDCLTVEEELELLDFYCSNLMELSSHLEYPTNVKATAVQFLKRFYLSSSPITYHPKTFVPTALFLATKCENHHTSLSKFATNLPNTTPEAVKAPEFTLLQGLRFTFEVRHPHRGLEGGFMELQAMLDGTYVPMPSSPLSPQGISEQILTVESDGSKKWEPTSAAVQKRLQMAHQKASALLKTTALLSDAYFLYTPAQIWIAAFLAADAPLAQFYLRTILASNPSAESSEPLSESILAVVEGCKDLLLSKESNALNEEQLKHLRKLEKKLGKCQNPEKADLSSLKGPTNPPSKRDSAEAKEDGHASKKRRVADDDVFGGEIKR